MPSHDHRPAISHLLDSAGSLLAGPQAATPPPVNAHVNPDPRTVDLEEAKRLCDAATPGPWLTDKWNRGAYIVGQVPGGRPGGEVIGDTRPTVDALVQRGYPILAQHANAEFIAASRSLVPALIAEAERSRVALAQLRELAEAAKATLPHAPYTGVSWLRLLEILDGAA